MPDALTAAAFIERLEAHRSPDELEKIQRYFKTAKGEYGEGDVFMGVRMGQVFALAKEFIEMLPGEIETLLESPIHEIWAGGLSIMDKQARRKKTPASRRKELFYLYMRRMDRINNWDLVDVSCPFVVGGYLFDKPRDILYALARTGMYGNAARPLSARPISFGKGMSLKPSGSPSSCSMTSTT